MIDTWSIDSLVSILHHIYTKCCTTVGFCQWNGFSWSFINIFCSLFCNQTRPVLYKFRNLQFVQAKICFHFSSHDHCFYSFGVIIERGVIRFLKGRPLETLLATFGISLILHYDIKTIWECANWQLDVLMKNLMNNYVLCTHGAVLRHK